MLTRSLEITQSDSLSCRRAHIETPRINIPPLSSISSEIPQRLLQGLWAAG